MFCKNKTTYKLPLPPFGSAQDGLPGEGWGEGKQNNKHPPSPRLPAVALGRAKVGREKELEDEAQLTTIFPVMLLWPGPQGTEQKKS